MHTNALFSYTCPRYLGGQRYAWAKPTEVSVSENQGTLNINTGNIFQSS